MGVSSKNFINARMEEDFYHSLDLEVKQRIEIRSIDVEGFDYSTDKVWNDLKRESNKTYRKLKDHEYFLRNK